MPQFQSELIKDLHARGCIKDCSDIAALDALLASGTRVAVYVGFDPTADSLHVGHLMSLSVMRRFAQAGHVVLPVLGTATALVGDPSGRSEARPVLDEEGMERNAEGLAESIARAIGADGDVRLLRNGDWFRGMGWIQFLREVGSHVPLGRMLALEAVRSRLGEDGGGISFLEFGYSLMQGFDFLHLGGEFPHLVQVGGSDQWGNICMGLELIGKRRGPMRGGAFDGGHAFGLTHPLLTKANGEKMGKSAGNAVWLNPARLDDFAFFRFWRTVDDADVVRLARLLSDRPLSEIEAFEGVDGRQLDALKEFLALEMTARIRGVDEAERALTASRGRGATAEGLEAVEVSPEELADLPALMVRLGLADSKGAARRLSAGGGVRVNGVATSRLALEEGDLKGGVAVVSAGKTRHAAVRVR